MDSFDIRMKKYFDIVIVGQGLAGSMLYYQLQKRGKKVAVIDSFEKDSSTSVAAGIINPMVLRRIIQSWKAKEFSDYNAAFYAEIQHYLGSEFYFEKPLVKLLANQNEINFWLKRYDEEENDAFISDKLLDLSPFTYLNNNYKKGGEVKQTAWVDTDTFLGAFRNHLLKNELIIEEKFDYNQLQLIDNKLIYKQLECDQLIFCEGAKAQQNPFFNYLPFSFVKGELITIQSNKLSDEYIFNKKIFILPIGNGYYKVGATYAWADYSNHPTEAKKQELVKDLNQLIDCDYQIVEHIAGIRPAVKDRRPLAGKHPSKKGLFIFNGLGSRGLSIAPQLSEEFVAYLLDHQKLDQEIDIERYSDYFKPD